MRTFGWSSYAGWARNLFPLEPVSARAPETGCTRGHIRTGLYRRLEHRSLCSEPRPSQVLADRFWCLYANTASDLRSRFALAAWFPRDEIPSVPARPGCPSLRFASCWRPESCSRRTRQLQAVCIEQRGLGHPGQIDLDHSIAGLANRSRLGVVNRMGNPDFDQKFALLVLRSNIRAKLPGAQFEPDILQIRDFGRPGDPVTYDQPTCSGSCCRRVREFTLSGPSRQKNP